jgi:hypothetical protein
MPAEFENFVIEHQQIFVVFTATTLQLFSPQFHIVKVRLPPSTGQASSAMER